MGAAFALVLQVVVVGLCLLVLPSKHSWGGAHSWLSWVALFLLPCQAEGAGTQCWGGHQNSTQHTARNLIENYLPHLMCRFITINGMLLAAMVVGSVLEVNYKVTGGGNSLYNLN